MSDAAVLELKHHHFAVSVPDIGQAIEWYGRVLGFQPEFDLDVPGAKIAVVRRGDLRIEFLSPQGGPKPLPAERREPSTDIRTEGNKHACFSVPDLPVAIAALKAHGVEIAADLGTAVYIRDLFGNLLEFTVQPDMWP